MLPVAHRLRHANDIRRVRRHGRTWHHPLLVLMIATGEQAESRFAFVASRRVGKAVARNRAKRLLREAVRAQLPHIESGWDCVIVAREQSARATFAEMQTAVAQLFSRAGLMVKEES